MSEPLIREGPIKVVHTPQKARLRVVEQVSFQGPNTEAVAFETRVGRWLESDQQPCLRVGVKIDTNWICLNDIKGIYLDPDKISMLILKNLPPEFSVIPTKEQQQEADSNVLEVSFKGSTEADCRIPRGESTRFHPTDIRNIFVRCASGETKISLVLYPQ